MFPTPRYSKPGSAAHVVRPPASFTRSGGGFGASQILALAPAAWYRMGVGQTVATGVSVWADQSGNGRNLAQATGGSQPTQQADGSLLFDGAAQFMTGTFTLNQPTSIYLLMKQVVWTSGKRVFDGGALLTCFASMNAASPGININAGSSLASNNDPPLNSFFVIAFVVNGANSSIVVNSGAAITGNAGANNPAGFTIGAQFGGGNLSNIAVKEVILFPTAHDSQTALKVARYLGRVGGLTF